MPYTEGHSIDGLQSVDAPAARPGRYSVGRASDPYRRDVALQAGKGRKQGQDKVGAPTSRSMETAPGRNGKPSRETRALLRKIESLQTRLSRLSEASRRVSEDLDLNVVLQEVIDNARYLTNARYGALLTYEQSGDMQDFITSGMSPQEMERLNTSPRGLGLLGYMNEIQAPLRLADIASHPSSVGFPENHPPMKTFLGMPIRHRGEHVGNIYLTEKESGREFTSDDEDTLVMFASQAGAAISNARRHREEQQAKADLEALVNISPVGVLVFDAGTGDLISANDETRRIVGKLHTRDRSLKQLLQVVSLRRPDGSDIPMDELPIIKAVRTGDTVIADEVVIHLPDGREAISALINARPIRQESGDIVSVVATIQNITPLEDLKRQRAEFLQSVSHELRTPLTAIKGSVSSMLNSPYPPAPTEIRQFLRVIDEQSDRMRQIINDLVDMTEIESGALVVQPEPTDVADLLNQAKEMHARSDEEDGAIELALAPDLPRVMADKRRILQVLVNLIARVSSYSPTSRTVRISAAPSDPYVTVTLTHQSSIMTSHKSLDHLEGMRRESDGRLPRRASRDNLRIAISHGIVEAHGGRLWVEEGDAVGIRFTFTIPLVDKAASLAEARSARDSNGRQTHILVACQDRETQRYVRNAVSEAGFRAVVGSDPYEYERLIQENSPQVILLEPTLPWDAGLETLAQVGRISDAPVIFVAGPSWDLQIGRVFDLGAFDYIAKPFTSTELIARINVALRRVWEANWRESSKRYLYGDLAIDYAARDVTVAGRPVRLTPTEYRLLAELSAASGRVLTHEQLLQRVWGPLYSGDIRIVRQYVKELRQKLGDDASSPSYIFTELGVGYRMAKSSA